MSEIDRCLAYIRSCQKRLRDGDPNEIGILHGIADHYIELTLMGWDMSMLASEKILNDFLAELESAPTAAARRSLVTRAISVTELLDYDAFVDEMWFYDARDHGAMPEVGYTALCVAGEAGEVAEKTKKAYRDSRGAIDREDLKKELGDLLFYLVKFAHLQGFNLNDVVKANMEKLRSRKDRGKMHGQGDNR